MRLMEKETRSAIETATQKARRLLEADFQEQLDGVFDVRADGRVADEPGAHLDAGQRRVRRKIVAAIEHKRAGGMKPAEAVADYLRDAAFTLVNRFVALKMLEARELVQPCVSQGEASSGFTEFCGFAPGVRTSDGSGYRLYLECLFDELSTEVKVLFDRRDAPSALWPRRSAFLELLDILNATVLAGVWAEDETIGWVYQYFNGQDERRAMRDASQAPRNSRELAVRNQFFTPRYVVQFLTDNTLGRIWYEMRNGVTALTDQCDYMVREPDETWAPRAKKDPRELRVLDPACGSGHFLLYAFDLLVTIYEEGWADPASPASEVTGATLRADYPDLDALKLAMPGLILAHNLHGVDIDPRCAQIAQLALWMRAQRAFREFGVNRTTRPLIRRSNIVIAEPMPGELDLRDEFLEGLKEDRLEGLLRRTLGIPSGQPLRTTRAMADSLASLVKTVWDEMALAGDLGVLLKVQSTLVRAIEKARDEWEGKLPLFRGAEYGLTEGRITPDDKAAVQYLQPQELEFWSKAERLVFRALEEYAVAVKGPRGTHRRLFADDAAHGFALVDLAAKKFDATLMNPPFGSPTEKGGALLKSRGSNGWKDIYAAFFESSISMSSCGGLIGAITSSQYFHTRQMRGLRDILVSDGKLRLLVDLGPGVLDGAAVQTALAVIGEQCENGRLSYVDMFDSEEKEAELRSNVRRKELRSIPLSDIDAIPGKPFCLHAEMGVLKQWGIDGPIDPVAVTVATGNHTFDDDRFIRLRHEVNPNDIGSNWRTFEKGGEYSPFMSPTRQVLCWDKEGAALRALNFAKNGTDAQVMQSSKHWGKPGICFNHVSSIGFSPRVLQAEIIFSSESIGIFPHTRSSSSVEHDALTLLGFLSSTAAQELVWVFGRTRKIENRAVSGLPVSFSRLDGRAAEMSECASRGLDLSFKLSGLDEVDPYFIEPDALADGDYAGTTRSNIASEFVNLYGVIDAVVEEVLALPGRDIRAPRRSSLVQNFVSKRIATSRKDRARDLAMWSIGVAFGRWKVFPGTSNPSHESTFFRAIPSVPPAAGGGATRAILVDDDGHPEDVIGLVNEAVTPRAISEEELISALESGSIRAFFRYEFFNHHLRRYSGLRRKAPIYWQLATPSASYSVWLYIHAFSKDTLFRVQNDYVAPKLAHERRELEGLIAEAGPSPTTAQSRVIEGQTAFVEELAAMLDEVKRVAPLWDPNLDDGVILNFAPLWRLVPQNRVWQKELRAAWASLVDGDYDWAHLAMRLWPERVVPKCSKDRSLAIAHDLEDVFWFEDAAGKWQARPTPTRPLDDLIAERTSLAVKATLQSLLEAPEPVATSGRGRRKQS